jgi:S1-C subfamily serine protease
LVAGLVTTLVAGAAFWFGRASAPSIDDAALTAVTAAAPATVPSTTTPEPAVRDTQVRPPEGTPPVDPSNPEPVAAVAAAVGPAVVQLEVGTGVGSGVLYDADGLILTAAHVVDGVSSLTVRLADGLRVPGEVVGLHLPTDVAVVRIDPVDDVPVARLGTETDPVVGQRAVALGSPFGLDQSVTAGIVSAVNREVNGVGMIQTDAAINPGNSGGPLVDISGNVIGINDAIRTLSGANDGVGFAIPIDLAVIVADQLVAGGDVELARLGVTSQPFNDGRVGALVIEVVEGSAADEAGLQVGDLITAVDGAVISDPGALRGEILSEAPGTEIVLEIVREGEIATLRAVLGAASVG